MSFEVKQQIILSIVLPYNSLTLFRLLNRHIKHVTNLNKVNNAVAMTIN